MARIPFSRKSKPTRQVTGTSLSAKGSVKPPTLGEIGSQTGSVIFDPIPELSPGQANTTYTKMVRSDASVRVSLRAGKAPVLGADYYFEPVDDDPVNEFIKDFVEFNLFHGMTITFAKTLEQILKMYEYGWQLFEPVWELREWAPPASEPTTPGTRPRRQYTMLRKLAPRPVSTIGKITYDDNGGPVSFEQKALRAGGKVDTVTIPIEKAIFFTFDQDGGDIRGNSILRSAYQHWYYKDYLYKIDAVQKERHGIGIPDIELQPGFSKADMRVAHEVGANLRTNEKAYVVRTTMMKIGFAELQGQLVNALESAQHHDNMIMKNVMVQFLNLGIDSSGGGRATGATAMDMFLKSMRYVAGTICDAFNMYLIPQLVAYNFPTDKFPKLCVKNIGEAKDLQMWSAAISNLVKNGALQLEDDLEQWVRENVDAPKRTTPFEKKETAASTNPKGNPNGNPGERQGNVGKSDSSGAV